MLFCFVLKRKTCNLTQENVCKTRMEPQGGDMTDRPCRVLVMEHVEHSKDRVDHHGGA